MGDRRLLRGFGTGRRLRSALRRFGLAGVVRRAVDLLLSYPARRRRARRSREFDRLHGVETAGVVRLSELEIASENVDLGVRYQPSGTEGVRSVLRALPIDYAAYTFIDLGSGKGRVLLLASELPFRRIVGVEFSSELNEIARRNLAAWRASHHACGDIELVTSDVVDFELPREPTVLYLYNPFAEPVLRRVLARLRETLEAHPRGVLVILNGASELEPALSRFGLVRLDLPEAGPATAVFVAEPPGLRPAGR